MEAYTKLKSEQEQKTNDDEKENQNNNEDSNDIPGWNRYDPKYH